MRLKVLHSTYRGGPQQLDSEKSSSLQGQESLQSLSRLGLALCQQANPSSQGSAMSPGDICIKVGSLDETSLIFFGSWDYRWSLL